MVGERETDRYKQDYSHLWVDIKRRDDNFSGIAGKRTSNRASKARLFLTSNEKIRLEHHWMRLLALPRGENSNFMLKSDFNHVISRSRRFLAPVAHFATTKMGAGCENDQGHGIAAGPSRPN